MNSSVAASPPWCLRPELKLVRNFGFFALFLLAPLSDDREDGEQ